MAEYHLMAKILGQDLEYVLNVDIPLLEAQLAAVRSNLAKSASRADNNIPDEYNKLEFAGLKTLQLGLESLFGGDKEPDKKKSGGAKNIRQINAKDVV